MRGLKYHIQYGVFVFLMSHPVRGAWIEIKGFTQKDVAEMVASRKGCVD